MFVEDECGEQLPEPTRVSEQGRRGIPVGTGGEEKRDGGRQ